MASKTTKTDADVSATEPALAGSTEDAQPPRHASPSVPAKAESAAPIKLTPDQWGRKLGHFRGGDARLPQNVPHFSAEHSAADQLHGWAQHAYHYQAAPFLVSEADYTEALKAAGKYPCCPPHADALPASQAVRFANFKPRAERVKGAR